MFKGFFERIRETFRRSEITDDLYDELEEALILGDVSVTTSSELVENLREAVRRQGMKDVDRAYALLREQVSGLLMGHAKPFVMHPQQIPVVALIVGVNGVGKTTTVAKMAHYLKRKGHEVLIVAGDTFRAAAIEQLELWGGRIGIEVVRHQMGADPAAVVFDALQTAKARKIDYVLIDTAGRLHTKHNLMEELKKINRVVQRELGRDADETLLVVDATTGQNALVQAREFANAVGLTGIILTKLDGTAKGGNVLSIAAEIPVSIPFIGTGERADDFAPFSPTQFAQQLLPEPEGE